MQRRSGSGWRFWIAFGAMQPSKEGPRVFHHSPSAWKLTVEVFNVGETLAEEGLPNTADSRQPDHGAFTPGLRDEFLPEVSLHHMHV
ncbi:MAG: hypothetical protein ABR920_02065 [Terriglobales bacterium]